MIKVIIKNGKSGINEVNITGHALYADYGKDIVCAGVSSIVITTINAIIKYDKNAITYDNKNGIFIKLKKSDRVVKILIENMVSLLKELENLYPKNIKIEGDEKNE